MLLCAVCIILYWWLTDWRNRVLIVMCVDGDKDTRVGGVSLVWSAETSTPLQTTTGYHTHPHNCKWTAVYACVSVSATGRVLTAVSELNDVNGRLTAACDVRCTLHTHTHARRTLVYTVRVYYTHSHVHSRIYYIRKCSACAFKLQERERDRERERWKNREQERPNDALGLAVYRSAGSVVKGFGPNIPPHTVFVQVPIRPQRRLRRRDVYNCINIHTTRRDRYASHRFDKPLYILYIQCILYNVI